MSIERQVEILNELTAIVHEETDGSYDVANCIYKYGEGFCGTEFWWTSSGNETSKAMSSESRDRNYELLSELHGIMLEHTGGDWNTLEISLDKSGKAKSNFSYGELF